MASGRLYCGPTMQPARINVTAPAPDSGRNVCLMWLRLLSNEHLLSLAKQVARIADEYLSAAQALRDVDLRAHVLTDVDGDEVHRVVGSYLDDMHAILID